MNEYTASNGFQVVVGDRATTVRRNGFGIEIAPDRVEALREFFRTERDEQLGRERDPENANFVFYPGSNDKLGDDYVNVLDESKGTRHGAYYRSTMGQRAAFGKSYNGRDLDEYELAAIRYFVAHPKPEPKPWESLKMGEAWVLTIEGREEVFTVDQFLNLRATNGVKLGANTDGEVTAGRRIFPPEASS